MVRYACVINDLSHSAGRSGMGAVMGSKKLKAIAVRGRGQIGLADPERIRELARKISDNKDLRAQRSKYGTTAGTGGQNASGGLPTRNFQTGFFEDGDKITGDALNASSWSTSTPAAPARSTASASSRPRSRTRSSGATAAPSTRPSARSARTAASATWRPSARPTSSATPTASTPSPPASRSASRWSASRRAS